MPFRTTTLPSLTSQVAMNVPELGDGELAYAIVSLADTLFANFPEGSPVIVDAVYVPLPPPGGAGPIALGATLLAGSLLRVLWRGPSAAQVAEPRVTIFSTILIS